MDGSLVRIAGGTAPRRALTLGLLLFAGLMARADPVVITLESLLQEIADLERLTALSDPPYSTALASSYDGATARLYGDGQLLQSAPCDWSLSRGAAYLGKQVHGSEPWNGRIDEVRLADTALSAAWIRTSYNNRSPPRRSTRSAPRSRRLSPGGASASGSPSITRGSRARRICSASPS